MNQTPEQIAKLELKHGIRNITLDSPKSTYNNLVKIKVKPLCGELFKRKREDLMFGKAKAFSIEYLFVKNNLTGIFITFDKRSEFEKLLGVLREL